MLRLSYARGRPVGRPDHPALVAQTSKSALTSAVPRGAGTAGWEACPTRSTSGAHRWLRPRLRRDRHAGPAKPKPSHLPRLARQKCRAHQGKGEHKVRPYERLGLNRFSRSELLTTETLENDIAAAAMMGFSVTLKNG